MLQFRNILLNISYQTSNAIPASYHSLISHPILYFFCHYYNHQRSLSTFLIRTFAPFLIFFVLSLPALLFYPIILWRLDDSRFSVLCVVSLAVSNSVVRWFAVSSVALRLEKGRRRMGVWDVIKALNHLKARRLGSPEFGLTPLNRIVSLMNMHCHIHIPRPMAKLEADRITSPSRNSREPHQRKLTKR